MIKIGIIGYRGKVGQKIVKECSNSKDVVVSIVHSRNAKNHDERFDVTSSIEALVNNCDVVIDFSRPSTSMQAMQICVKKNKKIVCGTTGFSKKELLYIKSLSQDGQIFYATNMSIGINLIIDTMELLLSKLKMQHIVPSINIIEAHHKNKIDKPSGTSITIADVFEKHNIISEICSLRYGECTNMHEIIMSMNMENITFKHEIVNRKVFAIGAIKAAKFLFKCNANGLYGMKDLLNSI